MTPKKRKIYLAIIISCFLLTGGILYFGFFQSQGTSVSNLPIVVSGPNGTPTSDNPITSSSDDTGANINYSAPSVFPKDINFDLTLLSDPTFQSLKAIPNLEVGSVGRPNPFNAY